ncbi:NMD3 protein, partial [Polypterus senegalus]
MFSELMQDIKKSEKANEKARVKANEKLRQELQQANERLQQANERLRQELQLKLRQVLGKIEEHIQENSVKLSTLTDQVEDLKETFTTRIEIAENLAASAEEKAVNVSSKCKKLRDRLAALEDGSRRSNVRIEGLPENRESPNPVKFAAELFSKIIGEDFKADSEIAAAYRVRGSNTVRPRYFIIRFERLSFKLEVMNGAILQQVFVVEFVIQAQMCDDCHRIEAKDFWKAIVQVRQKDNVVCLSPRLAQSLGNMNQICVCIRVTNTIHLIDPCTLQMAEVDGSTYWRYPFSSLCDPRQLQEFIVMDIEIIRDQKQGAGAGIRSNKVLIKKSYDRSKRLHRRMWRLKELERDREVMDSDNEGQYQDFLEDLEEDEALRKNINIFRDPSKIPVESDTDDEGAPRISLMEMLEDLCISEDATGGEGADMMTS